MKQIVNNDVSKDSLIRSSSWQNSERCDFSKQTWAPFAFIYDLCFVLSSLGPDSKSIQQGFQKNKPQTQWPIEISWNVLKSVVTIVVSSLFCEGPTLKTSSPVTSGDDLENFNRKLLNEKISQLESLTFSSFPNWKLTEGPCSVFRWFRHSLPLPCLSK